MTDDILAKFDRASRIHSLEARAPFLDIELVDPVHRCPMDLKFRGGRAKYLLPLEMVNHPEQGFAVQVGRWFQRGALALDSAKLPAFLGVAQGQVRVEAYRADHVEERMFLWATSLLQRTRVGLR